MIERGFKYRFWYCYYTIEFYVVRFIFRIRERCTWDFYSRF